MTPDYQQLASYLQKRLDVIADQVLRENHPEQQLEQLKKLSENLSAWHNDHRKNIPPQLNHFLQQMSLSKALHYLQTEGLLNN